MRARLPLSQRPIRGRQPSPTTSAALRARSGGRGPLLSRTLLPFPCPTAALPRRPPWRTRRGRAVLLRPRRWTGSGQGRKPCGLAQAAFSSAPATRAPTPIGRLASQPPSPPAPPAGPRQSDQARAGGDEDQNLQARKNAFLDSEGSASRKDYLVATVRKPKSPYEVKAGAIIPTVLVTAVNSDLPGPVIAQVREHVYDTISGNYLLIPQGSRLLANYDSMVAWGQERVLLCWNRLIFPNGNSVDLDCMPGADLQGAAGLTDDVDHHWDRIVKGAAISSLLAATATGIAGSTEGFQPTVPQTFARNASSQINQVGQQITRKNINIQPTISVRPGYSVNVIITRDMIIAPYPDAAFVPSLRNPGATLPAAPSQP